VLAFNAAGYSTMHTVHFDVDVVAPIVIIDSPAPGTIINITSIYVSWTGTDEGSGIAYYSFNLDGTGWSSPTSSTNFTFNNLGDGAHTVAVRAFDLAGNQADFSVTFVVDTVDPSVTITAPINGWMTNLTSQYFSWSGSDATSGVAAYRFQLDSGGWSAWSMVNHTTITGLGEGLHTFLVEVIDNSGNTAEASITFLIDLTDPTIEITDPAQGGYHNSSTVQAHWFGYDGGSGLDWYEFQLDGGEWYAVGQANSQFLFGLLDGNHTLTVRVHDYAGNFASTSVNFTVDTVAPVIEIISPQNGSFNNTGDVVIVWSGSDANLMNYTYSINGGAWIEITGLATSAELMGLTDGSYNITVRAFDDAGNYNEAYVEFVVDTVPPSLSVEVPPYSNNGNTTVQWTASDAWGIDHFNYTIDGTTWYEVNATTLEAFFTDLPNGEYTVTVVAYDLAGNHAEDTASFIVDTVNPNIEIIAPSEGSYLNMTSVNLEWTAGDANGLAQVLIRVDGGSWIAVDVLNVSQVLNGLIDGDHVVDIQVTDLAGNVNETSVSFNVDTEAPNVTVIAPLDGSLFNHNNVLFQWSAEDTNSGIAGMRYRLDGGAWSDLALISEIDISGLTEGQHTFEVMAVDNAGNTAVSSVSITVDTVAPEVEITSPLNQSLIGTSTVEFEWFASDETSGVAGYQFALDSNAWSSVTTDLGVTLASISDGPHTLRLKAIDAAGNTAEAFIEFTIDTTAPEIIIDWPYDEFLTNSSAVTVVWHGTDATSGVRGYQYRVDGLSWHAESSATSIALSALTDGTHHIEVRVYDNVGLYAEADVSFTVDTTPPELIEASPIGDGVAITSEITVTFNETMNPTSVVVTVDGMEGTLSWDENTATFTPSANLSRDTTYTVHVQGKDLAGNWVKAEWMFQTENTTTTKFTVVDQNDDPVANLTVSIDGTNYTTAGDGTITVVLQDGKHVVVISKEGQPLGTFNITAGPGNENQTLKVYIAPANISPEALPWWIIPFVVVLIALLLLLFLLAMRRRYKVIVTDVVKGKVLNRRNHPVAGVKVILETGQSMVTDGEGNFQLPGTARNYTLTLEENGKRSQPFSVSVSPGQTYETKLQRLKKGN
jgi:hypothetical protein